MSDNDAEELLLAADGGDHRAEQAFQGRRTDQADQDPAALPVQDPDGDLGGQRGLACPYLTVRAETLVEAPAPVACAIPGFDQPDREVIAGTFRVDDAPLSWELHRRCGLAADFAYSSGD